MARIQLRVYRAPGQAEVFLNIKRRDGGYEKRAAIVDTGAQVSLLPSFLLADLDFRLGERETFRVEQAGIARQTFQAVEAYITVFIEDDAGNRTRDFEVRAWFADASDPLLGFDGILEAAILYLDMPNLAGYLEFP